MVSHLRHQPHRPDDQHLAITAFLGNLGHLPRDHSASSFHGERRGPARRRHSHRRNTLRHCILGLYLLHDGRHRPSPRRWKPFPWSHSPLRANYVALQCIGSHESAGRRWRFLVSTERSLLLPRAPRHRLRSAYHRNQLQRAPRQCSGSERRCQPLNSPPLPWWRF